MDAINVGWLSLVPPIFAIILALITKEVISSLLIGILSGSFIYAIATSMNPVVGTVKTTFQIMASKMDVNILLFLGLLGILVAVIGKAGGSSAYGRWASSKLKNKKAALLSTAALGSVIFIDDYFNCLTVGTVMRPVTDKFHISRAKLAYIIDATAAPICIIAPVSSWAVAVGSNLRATGSFQSDLSAFVATVPYNLYAILSIFLVLLLCLTNLDFGPMAAVEKAAKNGDLGNIEKKLPDSGISAKGKVYDMIIPILSLIFFSVLAMLENGGFWGDDPAYHTIAAAFGNCSASEALVIGGFSALVVSFFLFVPRRLLKFKEFMQAVTEGISSMVPAFVILILAWTISGICRDYLSTGDYVKTLVEGSSLNGNLLPAITFITAGFLSFAMGTAWGTFGILIPIIVPVCASAAPELMIVTLSATLAGSVFGDHCSPISDTTILSSTGAGCDHIQHVSTQITYSLVVAGCSLAGYLVSGITGGNLFFTWFTALGLLVLTVILFHKLSVKRLSSKLEND